MTSSNFDVMSDNLWSHKSVNKDNVVSKLTKFNSQHRAHLLFKFHDYLRIRACLTKSPSFWTGLVLEMTTQGHIKLCRMIDPIKTDILGEIRKFLWISNTAKLRKNPTLMTSSQILEMSQNFANAFKVSRRLYKVSSPYMVFNLLAVTIVSEKILRELWGCTAPFEVPRKPPSTHLKNWKIKKKTPEIVLITFTKNLLRTLHPP